MKKMKSALLVVGCVGSLLYLGFFLGWVDVPRAAQQQEPQECTKNTIKDKFIGQRGPEKQRELPQIVRMLVWNIHKEYSQGWLEEFEHFADQATIIALQEGSDAVQLNSFLQDKGFHWQLATTFTYKDQEAGVLTASIPTPDLECSLFTMEPVLQIPKAVLVSRYDLIGRADQLLVVNVHLINFTIGPKEYRAQLERLEEVLQSHVGPIVVAGDFNSWDNEREGIVAVSVARLGLEPVVFGEDHRSEFFDHKVDHIFVRGVNVLSAQSNISLRSDHNPMLIDFSVK